MMRGKAEEGGQIYRAADRGMSGLLTAYSLQPIALEDIRDIRGPIHIPYPWLWLLWGAGGLVVVALLFQLYRLWKRGKQTVKIRLPHEIALERLEKARRWMNASQAREFSIGVSDAVRLYIEDRFQERAAHRTTEEFLYDLLVPLDGIAAPPGVNPNRSTSALSRHATLLEDFLRHCDLAKFARWSLAIPEMEAMLASAIKFVEETRVQHETGSNISLSQTDPRPSKLSPQPSALSPQS